MEEKEEKRREGERESSIHSIRRHQRAMQPDNWRPSMSQDSRYAFVCVVVTEKDLKHADITSMTSIVEWIDRRYPLTRTRSKPLEAIPSNVCPNYISVICGTILCYFYACMLLLVAGRPRLASRLACPRPQEYAHDAKRACGRRGVVHSPLL